MERKTLKQVLDEKRALEGETTKKTEKNDDSEYSVYTLMTIAFLLANAGQESPLVRKLELDVAELKGKVSVLEKRK